MKSSLVKMSKFHPLLTDTLPYEVPVLFSNRGLYETLRGAYDTYYTDIVKRRAKGIEYTVPKTIENFIKDVFLENTPSLLRDKIKSLFEKELLPYEYMIIKNKDKQRKISLIHPISQIKICDFYSQYVDEILFHTSCSDVSLRHPIKVTSRTFRQHTSLLNKLTREEEQTNCDDPREVLEDKNIFELEDIPNNYFVYKKYRHIHAFYASKEFLELEQRFGICFKFDIKRCFDSIYTHSISWAIKGKEYAKHNRGSKETFENQIDKLMQQSNWSETHGIPIGSEFSRIFAEIILQKIDQEVEGRLETTDFKVNGNNIKNGVDFRIRRYVDDFFVFVNSEDVGKAILAEYESILLKYKLFPNEEKYKIMFRPFITNITVAKQKISEELKETLRAFHNIDKNDQRLSSKNIFSNAENCSYTIVKRSIDNIRITIFDNKIEMIDISNLILSQIKTELTKILKIILSLKNTDDAYMTQLIKEAKKYLTCVLDISFYVFHLSARANATYGICKICFEIIEILKKLGDDNLEKEIKQLIYSQFLLFFENKKTTKPLIEFLDIIWVIDELGDAYNLPENRLLDMINTKNNTLSYFEIMVVLSYIKDNKKYAKIYNLILKHIKENFKKATDIFKQADTFMMFFDIIKCPYLDKDYKMEILSIAGFNSNQNEIINFIKNNKWFYGWEEKLTLKKLFEIKELQNAY